MKRIALLAVSVLLAGTSAIAQTKSTTTAKGPGSTRFGLKAGVNLAKYSFGRDNADNDESDHTTSAHVTGYADIPLGRAFSLQPAISLQGKGGEFGFTSAQGPATRHDDVMYAEIPVNLVARLPLGSTGTNFFLGAGPYAAFAISGQTNTTINASGNDNKRDMNFGDSASDDLKGVDFGINGMAGIQLMNGFNIGAGYGLGLKDVNPTGVGGENQKNNRVISVSVGYQF